MKVVSPKMTELFHGIRSQLTALLDGLDPKDLATMSLGLSHSLSRYVYIVAKSCLDGRRDQSKFADHASADLSSNSHPTRSTL